MNVRSCRVSVKDLHGVEHTVEVSASSLFEAVAHGLVAVQRCSWAGELPEGLNIIEVSVMEISVKHTVMFKDFREWMERKGGSPRDIAQRGRVHEILGFK